MKYNKKPVEERLDQFTRELFADLFAPQDADPSFSQDLAHEIADLLDQSENSEMTAPIVNLFTRLKEARNNHGASPDAFGISRGTLIHLAEKHQNIDEHEVSVGGRVNKAQDIVHRADLRIEDYLKRKDVEAPSGLELWDKIQENSLRIKLALQI